MSVDIFEFRQADPSEVEEITLVQERANAARDGNPLPTAIESDGQAIGAMKARMNRIEAQVNVATLGEKIVGFSLTHLLVDSEHSISNSDTQHLSLLMVDPDYWGRRVASRLLDIAAEQARNSGRRHLTLWTRVANNSRARTVYAHKGFILTGIERTSEYGDQVQYQLDL